MREKRRGEMLLKGSLRRRGGGFLVMLGELMGHVFGKKSEMSGGLFSPMLYSL